MLKQYFMYIIIFITVFDTVTMWGDYEPVLVYGFANFSVLTPEQFDSLVHDVVEHWEEADEADLLAGSIRRFVTYACKGRGYHEVWGVQLEDPFEGAKEASVHVAVSVEIQACVRRVFDDVQALLANREGAKAEEDEQEEEEACAPRLWMCLDGDIE